MNHRDDGRPKNMRGTARLGYRGASNVDRGWRGGTKTRHTKAWRNRLRPEMSHRTMAICPIWRWQKAVGPQSGCQQSSGPRAQHREVATRAIDPFGHEMISPGCSVPSRLGNEAGCPRAFVTDVGTRHCPTVGVEGSARLNGEVALASAGLARASPWRRSHPVRSACDELFGDPCRATKRHCLSPAFPAGRHRS